jgi:hypothetical protein
MPFANGDLISAADANNLVRGLNRDNATSTVTGTTDETDLSTFAMSGGTMTATGWIEVYANGQISGTAGTKTIRLDFGATTLATITHAAGTTEDWMFYARIANTATNAQRVLIIRTVDNGNALRHEYATAAIDTTASVTVKATAQLGNSGK